MRNLILLTAIIFGLSQSACNKSSLTEATYYSDCTGRWLRIGEKNFQLCNPDKFGSLETGTVVLIDFDVVEDCKNTADLGICYLYRIFEASVRVERFWRK